MMCSSLKVSLYTVISPNLRVDSNHASLPVPVQVECDLAQEQTANAITFYT